MKKSISVLLSIMIILYSLTILGIVNTNAATSSNWSWPTYNHNIQNDWPNYPGGGYHGGTDFPVVMNTPVYSSCDGEVLSVITDTGGYGKHVIIKASVNNADIKIIYGHLNSFVANQGDKVTSGDLIAYSGSTGNSTGPHLHYEVRYLNDGYGKSLKPSDYLPGTSLTFESHKEAFVDLGTNFYASITHLASWNHLTAEENSNVDICWDNNTANQYWKFYRYDDGSYKIKSASTGKCLEVEGGSWVNGANIQVYDDNGTDAQRWFVYKCGNGYQLKAKCTDCVMEMNAWNFYQGVNLVSGSSDGSDSEIFAINWKDFNDIGKTSLQVSCHNGIANFSWNNARCATNYNIKIWNGNSVLSGEAPINLWNVKNNNFSINLGDGTYTAYIESFNKLGDYVQSSPITFNVSTSEYRAAYIKTENNHTYSIYNIPTTWEKAEEICKNLGGHLVTITSQDEQIIVNELLEYGNLSFYSIGGKRIGDSNNWEWINGEIFDFTNWATGEPNNVNNIENYLSVFNTSIKGYWNDSTNSASEGFCNGFICEVENTFKPSKIENYNGHTYSLFETSLSWENAKEFCEKSGGHLVTINDSMEQEFIENLLTYGEKELYWLGGVKEDDSFVWLDGKTITYDNYYDGEPNNYDNLESFLQISNAGTTKYKWNDNKNTPPDFSYGFIMETERIKGDVNGDGVISIVDATDLQKYLANIVDFDDEQLAVADTNGDGNVDIKDATQIQKYLAQLITSLG